VLISILPLSLVNSFVWPGESTVTVILALEPGPFIASTFRAVPDAFSVGNPFFQVAAIFTNYSARHFKNYSFFRLIFITAASTCKQQAHYQYSCNQDGFMQKIILPSNFPVWLTSIIILYE